MISIIISLVAVILSLVVAGRYAQQKERIDKQKERIDKHEKVINLAIDLIEKSAEDAKRFQLITADFAKYTSDCLESIIKNSPESSPKDLDKKVDKNDLN